MLNTLPIDVARRYCLVRRREVARAFETLSPAEPGLWVRVALEANLAIDS